MVEEKWVSKATITPMNLTVSDNREVANIVRIDRIRVLIYG
jgi:hypothetical protein